MTSLRVLLVDDDADQRLVIDRLLRDHGIDAVAHAADAEEAVRALGVAEFDLVVLDIAMPGRSGLDVLPDLQALTGAPIVMVSSFSRSEFADLAASRGATGYVEKRTSPARIIDEILLAAALTIGTSNAVVTQLDQTLDAPSGARRLVRQHLATEAEDMVAIAEVLVSELVTNAVVHASSAPRVEVRVGPDLVRVAVFDDDPTLPSARPMQLVRPGGRGLLLVEELASRWGAEPRTEGGKVVWFEFDR